MGSRKRSWDQEKRFGLTGVVGTRFLPNNDDDKVQQVPAVSDVGAGMHHQAVGQNLQEGLHCKDDEEDILHLFLQHTEIMKQK